MTSRDMRYRPPRRELEVSRQFSDCLAEQRVRIIKSGKKQGQKESIILRKCRNCSEEKWISAANIRRAIKKGIFTGMCTYCGASSRLTGVKGSSHPGWKTGRAIIGGYIYLRLPDNPMANANGYVAEHRVVMAEKIGRPLLASESVHHLNAIRNDNRLDNLELWERSQPAGRRSLPHCSTCICKP